MRATHWDTSDSGQQRQRSPVGSKQSPAAVPEVPVLDLAVFGAFRDVLDAKTLAEIYREFLAQTEARTRALPGMDGGEAVAKLAHTLKGTAGMLGANRVAARAARLERELKVKADLLQASGDIADECVALRLALSGEQVAL